MKWKKILNDEEHKENILRVVVLSTIFIGTLLLCCTGYVEWPVFYTLLCIIAIPVLLLLVFGIYIAISSVPEWRFNRKYNWLMKHKEELPIPDDYKEMLIERNRRFIGIDTGYYRSLRWYWLKKKLFKKRKQK